MAVDAAQSLKKKRDELITRFIKGKEKDFPARLSYIIDEYLVSRFEASETGLKLGMLNHPFTLIALGSYGRQEPSMCSDLALMFLFDNTLPPETGELIKEFVYPLWDMGFEVTHVTRTVDECVTAAEKNTDVLVSLLDGRFICGMSKLFLSVGETLRAQIVKARRSAILKEIADKNKARHQRFGDASYLVEPNLKDGQGGIGDFDALLSVARIKDGALVPSDLKHCGLVSEKEWNGLLTAHRFVLRVRNLLHHVTGRKCDQLFLEYQPPVADLLGYRKNSHQEAVECFLGDLHGHLETIKQQYTMVITELGLAGQSKKNRSSTMKKTRVRGLEMNEKNMLTFRSAKDILGSPELIMKIFGESAALGLPLSVDAIRLIRDLSPRLVTPDFRRSRSVLRAFEKVLAADSDANTALDDMVKTGFLTLFIPEFKGILNRMQYNEYHLFPVDKHSIMTVKKAAMFEMEQEAPPLCSGLYTDLGDKRPLLWACLLHDIGKSGHSDDHPEHGAIMAETLLRRMGYDEAFTETVAFLVKEHLFLVKTATRRDISDEDTAIICARRIKDDTRLVMLYLLTVADSMSTGPKAWNAWTGSLLASLFQKTRDLMGRKEFSDDDQVLELIEGKKTALALILKEKGYDARSVEKTIGLLSLRYLVHMDVHTMDRHMNLYRRLCSSPFVWDIEGVGGPEPRTVTIAAANRPGLFSRLAGLMTLYGFNILDAQIFTLKNNTAIDVFHLSPPSDLLFEEDRWNRATQELGNILTHDINLPVRIKDMIQRSVPNRLYTIKQPTRIEVDNETSGYFTIIEVHTYDFTGLLYTITTTLFRLGLDVYVAKIATNRDQVVDIFYVRNSYGQKVLANEQIDTIKREIRDVIDHPEF